MTMGVKQRAPRNRTLAVGEDEKDGLRGRLLRLGGPASVDSVINRTICQDMLEAADFLPQEFVDLLLLDPPYNLTKDFHQTRFKRVSQDEYAEYLDRWIAAIRPALKPTATIYICSEWRSSAAVFSVAEKHFTVRNRITWEREKGRGSLSNWKSCSEDIWFCTLSDNYQFNVDAVKLKRRVVAPYKDESGNPKDWESTSGGAFRVTHPSNLWTDITVPFWSMPENTDHPTQKPEKLIAKLILASSSREGVVLDPFLGSGTSSVVAKKLGRKFVGIEAEEAYCCLAEKRLELAGNDPGIQGYCDGVFWERNSLSQQRRNSDDRGLQASAAQAASLFGEDL